MPLGGTAKFRRTTGASIFPCHAFAAGRGERLCRQAGEAECRGPACLRSHAFGVGLESAEARACESLSVRPCVGGSLASLVAYPPVKPHRLPVPDPA